MCVDRLAELLRERQPCVVLTGAGISTESGIPDFRSAGGIWERYDPFEVANIDALRRDPARVWEFYALRLDALAEAEPNDGHRALAEARGAGLDPRDRDAERRRPPPARRLARGRRGARLAARGRVRPLRRARADGDAVASLPLPACPECGEVLKPGVVMFGELLPAAAIERAQQLAARGGSPPRRRLVARGASGRRPARRDARRGRGARHRQPRRDALGLPGRARPRRRRG